NTIIIFTSNLGTHYIQEGGAPEAVREKVMGEVRNHFRPELLNRLDDIILFTALSESELTLIVDVQLGRVRKLLETKNLSMVVDDKAKAALAKRGYDPIYGARPLKRLITELILNPLATQLLEGHFKEGDCVLFTCDDKGNIVFKKAPDQNAKQAG
ncbi:MAG: AAA family ATPase, partial [Bdellovibrionales bacterium]|nr:AAA family ATPase [Bdellovibrionales bacterium]